MSQRTLSQSHAGSVTLSPDLAPAPRSRPRLGFLGLGWIGRHRLEAVAQSGLADIAVLADASRPVATEAAKLAPDALVVDSLEAMLEEEVEGIVIATPSALHAEQAGTALACGVPVFCQKPLGRTAAETHTVIEAARKEDLLLGVDLSYRFLSGTRKIRKLCRQGGLGQIYAADLVFHNAYGPDKPWFYERKLSGGGCVIDLGIHLVDLALWCLDFPEVTAVSSRLFAQGKSISSRTNEVEDYAVARLDLATGATVTLACSWKLPAGHPAIINGSFFGTRGGAAFCNLNGSFYDFKAEQFHGTQRAVVAEGPEAWGGRAAVDWVRRLAAGARFSAEVETLGLVAQTLDAIYAC